MKAKFLQKKGAIREDHKKLRKLLVSIKKKAQELDEIGEDRSSSFSSGSPVLGGSTSESEKEDVAASGSGKAKGPVCRRQRGRKWPRHPPKSQRTPTPPPTPVSGSKSSGA